MFISIYKTKICSIRKTVEIQQMLPLECAPGFKQSFMGLYNDMYNIVASASNVWRNTSLRMG